MELPVCGARPLLPTQVILESRLWFSVVTSERSERTSQDEKSKKTKTTKGNQFKMRNSNITKNRTRIVLLLVLAGSIICLAPAFSTSATAASGSYSINDVSGNYVDLGDGFTTGDGNAKKSIQNPVPFSQVGLVTFTPSTGTFHADWIVRFYGESADVARDGTYTVDANGHGTMTWISATGNARQYDFYIVNGGAQLKYIVTDPPGTVYVSVSGTMTKQ